MQRKNKMACPAGVKYDVKTDFYNIIFISYAGIEFVDNIIWYDTRQVLRITHDFSLRFRFRDNTDNTFTDMYETRYK